MTGKAALCGGRAIMKLLSSPFSKGYLTGKNPARTNDVRWREHGASSMEKAIYIGGLIANGRRWSAPKPTWPFIPARESRASWLFHVGGAIRSTENPLLFDLGLQGLHRLFDD